jgi:copper chaperone CopZ
MKKVFRMENVDCANCAAKMSDAIRKLDGVNSATVNFLTQKLTLDADDARFSSIVKQAQACCKKIDPDCEILF